MKELEKKLQKFLGTDNHFFSFFQRNCNDGFWFWKLGETNQLIIDGKFASSHRLEPGILVIKHFSTPLINSISKTTKRIEQETSHTKDQKEFTLIVLEGKLNLQVQFFVLKDPSDEAQYIFASLYDISKQQSLDGGVTEVFDLATWLYNYKTGELSVNDIWFNLLGYSQHDFNEIDGNLFRKLMHPEDLQAVEKLLDDYFSGKVNDYISEVRMKHKNGHWIYIYSQGKLVDFPNEKKGEWIMGAHIDITKRKLEAQESEALAQVALKTTSSVMITNVEGRITFVNKAFEKLTGYKMQEVLGLIPGDFLQGPESNPEDIKDMSLMLKEGIPFTKEILNYTKTGEKYWTSINVNPVYDKDGQLDRFISLQHDISTRKENAEYLNTFKRTLDYIEDAVFIADKDTLQLTYVNKATELMMEHSREELLSLHPYDIISEITQEQLKQLTDQVKNASKKSIRFETTHDTRSGRHIIGEVYLQYVNDHSGRPYFVVVVQDITDKKRIKEEQKKLSLVAEKTNNLVVITDQLGVIQYVNPAFEQKTGYSLAEIVGKKPGTFLHGPATDPAHTKAIRSKLKKALPFTQEIINYNRKGEQYWVAITFNPVFGKTGRLEKYIAIEKDITERKQQEALLKESEERLRLVLEGSELGYWDWDLISKKLSVNDLWLEMLGYTKEHMEPTPAAWSNLIHPDDVHKLEFIIENHFQNPAKNEFSMEIRAKHQKGHYVWILDKGAVVKRDEKGNATRVSGIHSDISQRKKLEQTLAEERAFLDKVMETNVAAVLVFDNHGKIIYANAAANDEFGYQKEELEYQDYDDPKWKMTRLDGSPLAEEEHPFNIVMETGKAVYNNRIVVERKDKKRIVISLTGGPMRMIKGKPVEVVFSIIDVTEQEESKRELEQTKIQMESILTEMEDVIWSFDIVENKISFVTTSIKKLTGYSKDQFENDILNKESISNKWLEDIVHPEDKGILFEAVKQLKSIDEFESVYRIITANGEIKWILSKGKKVYKDNVPIRIDRFISDITDIRRKEIVLENHLKVIEGQNERLKNFTYIVSHNLRSHVANLHGLMYLIKSSEPEIYKNDFVQKIDLTSSKLDETLHYLNEIVSVVSTIERMKKLNLYDIIEGLSGSLSNLIDKAGVEFINQVDSKQTVEAVPAYIESILMNFITNSVKYSDPEKDSYLKVRSKQVNGKIEISVEDNGVGIDLNLHKDKIFGMYKTFHGNKDGRGLGLFLAKNQAESMGGKIEIESEPGEGSTFTLKLNNGTT